MVSGAPLSSLPPAQLLLMQNTPTVIRFDTLGRTFLTIADNGADDE
jgi:hypothetical protein